MAVREEAIDFVFDSLQAKNREELYRKDPVLWAEEYLGIWLWSKQKEILYSIRDNRKTAVAAGHGVGKSFVAAIAMAWWIDTHPLGADASGAPQTFIASTAPFSDQVTGILWNNLRIIHGLAKQRHKEYLKRKRTRQDLGRYKYATHPLPGTITGDNRWKTDDGLLVGQGRKPPDNKTDSGYQGLHARYLLAIGDEAAGLNSDMIDALSNITTGSDNRMLLIANPTAPKSPMARIWKELDANWIRMHISVYDSPLVTGEEIPEHAREAAKSLSGWDYINEKLAEWGEDDPRFISRVLGQWAFDVGDTLFSSAELASAANTVVVPWSGEPPVDGWDIARKGPDFTVGYRCEVGNIWETDPETGEPVQDTGRRGFRVRRIDKWNHAPLTGNDPTDLGSDSRIHDHAKVALPSHVVVDTTGMGGGVVDGLRDKNPHYTVVEYYGSGATTNPRSYTNARAEHYFNLKSAMRKGLIDLDPRDTELFGELEMITYEYDSKQRLKMESKEEIRRRGEKSPDHSDAVTYCAVFEIQGEQEPETRPGQKVYQDPLDYLGEIPDYLQQLTRF